jgi:hypothetical protein
MPPKNTTPYNSLQPKIKKHISQSHPKNSFGKRWNHRVLLKKIYSQLCSSFILA